jgi:hypothetical protein
MSDDKSPIGFIDLDPSEIEAATHRKVERDARIVQQEEEITRLRAELATARRDGMNEAAKIVINLSISAPSVVAAAIRALAKGEGDE